MNTVSASAVRRRQNGFCLQRNRLLVKMEPGVQSPLASSLRIGQSDLTPAFLDVRKTPQLLGMNLDARRGAEALPAAAPFVLMEPDSDCLRLETI